MLTKSTKISITVLLLMLITGCSGAQKAPEASFNQKIGQMLMVGFRGTEVSAQSPIAKDIQNYQLGGVVLFDHDVPADTSLRNVISPEQLQSLTTELQSFADIPLFISIDQEGGMVARLKPRHGFKPTVSAQYLGELNNPDSTRHYARQMARTLSRMGINMNLAPVVDLNTNPQNPVIGGLERSFSDDPGTVTEQAEAFIKIFREEDIITSLKHFPGHGSSEDDSHLGVVDVSRSWQQKELIPYRQLVQKDLADMIMTAHIFNTQLDSTYPATLSKPTITGLLRERIGYEGVIISDDLQMGAIRKEYGLRETITKSILAGVDILVFANNSVFDEDIASKAHAIIRDLVAEGVISKERIHRSYRRIMSLKQEYLGSNK